ncbi:MAG: exodeoxyribonuclease III [Planctomycetes bacterium]|nr:exodeoxyribonuclease III [Planctomycetota bacterium]
MKIATWNVNSVRARLPRLLPWLESARPDVVCLQEIKCLDEQFPREAIEELGYNVVTYGQKTYNGVAILSKQRPDAVVRGLPGEGPDAQKRVIGATIGDTLVFSLYVVNGEAVGSEKYAYKLDWMRRLAEFARTLDVKEKLVLCGDFNVTFDDRDVYDPVAWHEKILCSTPERDALKRVMEPGLVDAFRHFNQDAGQYTWWDFRTRGFQRGQGLRIDHFLLSEPALRCAEAVEIDVAARDGEKPSDHAPVIVTLA